MLTYEQSLAIATAHLAAQVAPECGDVVIVDSIDRPNGWVFFYQTRAYLDSGQIEFALAGNAPILVSRESGVVSPTGTAEPFEHYASICDASISQIVT